MTGKKDLVSMEAAAETLGLDEAEVAALLESGELRKIWHRAGNDSAAPLEAFVMGSDVKRIQKQADPRSLAALVLDGADPDDDESPHNLAAEVPRF